MAERGPRRWRQYAARRHQPRDEGVLSVLSPCERVFSGVCERHPRLTLAIVEFELARAPQLLSTMDHTYGEHHGGAIYRVEPTCCRAASSTAKSR